VVWSVSDAIFPYFLKRIVNTVQAFHGERAAIYTALSGVLALVALFWLMAEFFMRLQGILQIYTFPQFRAQIRKDIFDYATSHSHEYFSSHFAGNISKKLGDIPTSCQSLIEIIFFQFITAFTGAIIVLAMMWSTHHYFAVILMVWLSVHLTISFCAIRKGDNLWEIHSESQSVLNGKIVDVFTNMQNVRLFSRKQYEKKYLEYYQQDEINKSKKALWHTEITRILLGLNGLGLIFGIIFLLIYGWIHHFVSVGDFTQVIMQSWWLLGWMWYISFQLNVFAKENGTINNALRLIRQPHDLTDKKSAVPINITKGKIVFENVSFNYRKNNPVFKHLNITIPSGKKIGLVGFSGSGKSTFVNLILRFYDVNSGNILIDDQNISVVTQDSLRSQIAMIPQDPALFHRTLMENIRYGRLEATDEEVIEASKLSYCHEFIEKLDEEYQSLVGERGIKLSGGQRQRIAIARAILKNAPILILDEATSSLDSVTEKLIQESLRNLMQNRTTIIIAHRLSTLADMDEIFVFDKGNIIERGTKESLLNTNGHFAKLWNMQTNGFLPEE
jgi:ATP-binding cassette subfamily B protein